jgi:hypothetical protein
MKDKKSKITLTLDKEKIIKSKTMTDRFFPVSEMRMKKTQEVIKEDPIPLNLISSNNSENLKNKKKEKIHHILTKFQRSDINSKSSSAKKIDDLRYSDYLTRSKSKQIDLKSYNIKIKPLTSRLTQEVNSYRSNTQTKFFNNNHKETNTQFEDTVKNNSNLNRRRNEIKHTSVNPTQSAGRIQLFISQLLRWRNKITFLLLEIMKYKELILILRQRISLMKKKINT